MRKSLFTLLMLLTCSLAHAVEYGHYDPKKLLTTSETPTGKQYGFDLAYLDRILADLASHASNYPPKFDSPQDQQRATRDAWTVSGMLEIMIRPADASPALLLRAAHLNSMGHNLGIPDAAQKANVSFQRTLAATPADPRGNQMYGAFLAGTGKAIEALPYLQKAWEAGLPDAAYSLGMTHLMLADQTQALKYLEAYKQLRPQDTSIDPLLEAMRNGKLKINNNRGLQKAD